MPWKNYLTDPFVVGPIMSMFFAVIRVIYDQEESRPGRIMLEAIVCGLLTWTGGAAIRAMGLPDDWVLVVGGVIGFLGATVVRQIALRFLRRKAEK